MKDTIDKWVELELSKCPLLIIDRIGVNATKKLITENVETNISYCNDDEFAKKNFDYCKIKGSTFEDYKYRSLKTPLGELISSIRFLGGDLNKPSVLMVHKDFELESVEDIKFMCQFLSKEYSIFHPKRISWYSSKLETELIESNDFISGDMVYIAEFLDYLKQKPLPKNSDKIHLKKATSLSWYEEYKNEVNNILKNWSAFSEMHQIESKDTLQKLIEKELVFEVIIANEWAGIIAADTGSEYFLNGYFINEELLTKQFRGKKYAPAVQRHLLEKLPHNANEMLYGTIHFQNIPSMKTALRVGRKALGMYVFADIIGS